MFGELREREAKATGRCGGRRGGRDGEAAMDREEAVLPFPDFTSFTNLPLLSGGSCKEAA